MTKQPTKQVVRISAKGEVRAIYSQLTDDLAKALGGPVVTRRASHVEPTADLSEAALTDLAERKFHMTRDQVRQHFPLAWWADMTPVNGPVLGPYDNRDEALDDEKVWLEEHGIPVAGDSVPATTNS